MKASNKKLLFSVSLLLLCIFAAGFYSIQEYEASRKSEVMIFSEQSLSEKEDLKVEIINEANDQLLDDKKEEVLLEKDAEQLSVNEESEKTDTGEAAADKHQEKFSILPAPVKKKDDSDTLRIGLMTDLHVQSESGEGVLLSEYYTKKINYFVEKMNNVFSPNFILLNGDVIEGTRTSSEIGSKELSLLKNLFDRTIIKKYWVAGNHDLRSVNKKQWMKALKIDYMSESFDVGNYKIIILDGNFTREDVAIGPGIDYTRGKVSQKQVDWLRRELEKTDKKAIVFMHYPPLRDINAKTNLGLLYNAKELQDIFSQYGILAVFSGHIEDLYYQEIGGVDYFVSPGMVKYPKYLGAFSEITIKGKKVTITLDYLMGDGKYRTIKIEKNAGKT
ncbi:metallophosphoesterase [Patescibacteria group bacterium]|nr:metallophosphoesterase [Patescibacteria group bacterium]